MDKRRGFTLIELLVVIAIIALLMAILMPVLNEAKRQARDVVCMLNLKQWSIVFQLYANDHDGSTISDPPWRFEPGIPGPESWIGQYYGRYYEDKKLLLCPAAIKPLYESEEGWGKKNMAWYVETDTLSCLPPGFDLEGPPDPGVVGSYGINDWCYNGPPDAVDTWGFLVTLCWRNFEIDGAHNVPLFSDSLHIGHFPMDQDDPPELEDAPWTSSNGGAGMARVCIDRHGTGTINVLFMDFSVRPVGLKELWKLKWNKEFDINGPWTLAWPDFGGDAEACAAIWDAQAEWMKNFEEF